MINSSPFSRSQLDDSYLSSNIMQGEDYPSVSGHQELTPTNNRYRLDRSFGGLSENSTEPRQFPSSVSAIGNQSEATPFDYSAPREKTFTSPLRHSTSNYPAMVQQQTAFESSPPHASSLRSSYSGINNIHTTLPTSPKYQNLRKSIEPTRISPTSSISSCPISPITKDHTAFGLDSTNVLVRTPKNSVGFVHHFSTPSSSYVRVASDKGVPLCKIHQLPVDILCKECSELICAKCSRSSIHNSHDCQLIDEMDREKECRDIKSSVEVLESRISKVEQACGTTYELDLLARQHEEAVNEIRRDFERAREYLYKKEQELIDSLDMIVQSRIQFSNDIHSTKKKLEDSASMYPTESVSNYDIAQNKYVTVSNLKEKIEFLEIKLKFNGSCIDQDGKELQHKAQEVSSKISEISKHFDLAGYPFYNTLRATSKEK